MNTELEDVWEKRADVRYSYRHRLSITIDRRFARGEVIDWSLNGLKVSCSIQMEAHENHQIRFHVEKFQGLNKISKIWSREGTVSWIDLHENGCDLGIHLDEPLDIFPLDNLSHYITEEDCCYLFFLPHKSL